MTLEQAILTALRSDASLAALVGTRVHHVVLPQGSALPAVVFQRVSTVPQHAMGADAALTMARIQVTSLANADLTQGAVIGVLDVASAVKAALRDRRGLLGGASGVSVDRVFYEGDRVTYDDDPDGTYPGVWQVDQDYLVWYQDV